VFEARNFDDLLNFDQLTPQSFLGLLNQLSSFLGQFRNSSVFQTALPFTSFTLGRVLDLQQAFLARVTPLLESAPGEPAFQTAQDLARELAGLLGGDPSAVNYDITTNLLTYRIQFAHTFAVTQAPVAFAANLGSVAGLQSSSTLSLNAAVNVGLTFGVDLSPLAPDTTPNDPNDDDSLARHFFIINPTVTGTVSLAATDLEAVARLFNFVEIGVDQGSGSIQSTVAVSLRDPGTQTGTNGRITLPELLEGLGNISSLVTGPTITGFANLTLPVRLTTPVTGLALDPLARIVVAWPDVTNVSSLSVQLQNLDVLLNFQQFGFQQFLDALQGVVGYLRSLQGLGFLNQKIPLLNHSVSELLELADRFAERVNGFSTNPAQSLQAVEELLEDAFVPEPAGAPQTDDPLVELSLDGRAVRIDLTFSAQFNKAIPFNLDLASFGLASLSDFLSVEASGQIDLALGARLELDLGIDLTNPSSPTPFVYDSTALTLEAKALATNLNFNAGLGPLVLSVRNGTASLRAQTDRDQNPGTVDAAAFDVQVLDDPTDHRYRFSELFSDLGAASALTVLGLDAAAEVRLPVFVGASPLPPDLTLSIPNLAAFFRGTPGSFNINTPDFTGLINGLSLPNNFGAFLEGLDGFLGYLADALDGEAFGVSIPLIGDKLAGVVAAAWTRHANRSGRAPGVVRCAWTGLLEPVARPRRRSRCRPAGSGRRLRRPTHPIQSAPRACAGGAGHPAGFRAGSAGARAGRGRPGADTAGLELRPGGRAQPQ
jgi:hypothetical protein